MIFLMNGNDNFVAFNKSTDYKAVELLQRGIEQLKTTPDKFDISQLEEIIRDYL